MDDNEWMLLFLSPTALLALCLFVLLGTFATMASKSLKRKETGKAALYIIGCICSVCGLLWLLLVGIKGS